MEKYAVDLDGVVFDYLEPFLLHCKVKYNISFSDSDLCSANFVQKKFGDKAALELLDDFSKTNKYLNLPVMQYAKDAIKQLETFGEIYVLTARPSEYRKETIYTLIELGIDFREVFISSNIDKLSIMESLGITALMEDNDYLCDRATRVGIRSYCFEASYNKRYRRLNKNIIPVKNWMDVIAGEVRILRRGVK